VDHIATITIDRPEARNAVDGVVTDGLEAAVDALESDEDAWVGILTGAPPVFSAGADLRAVARGEGHSMLTERGGFAGIVRRERSKPLIVAVDGPALAGGTEIVLACDLVVASTNASFGIPEVKRGLVAAGGATFRLGRRLPLNLAMELALTGDPISAELAYAHGLVNHLCRPGEALARAQDLAARIAANAPLAVRETRAIVLTCTFTDDAAGWERGRVAHEVVMASDDLREGIDAFLETRPPSWTGR
jgi:enoyl-CoA hydratase